MTIYEGAIYVSSPYGWRTSPITGRAEHHNGKDLVGRQSKRLYFVAPKGKVLAVNTGYQSGRGNNVVIQSVDDPHRPGADVRLRYQHLASTPLTVGQVLTAGAAVGTEGSTGDSTGSHCHFEVTVNGAVVDPSPWDGLPNKTGIYTKEGGTTEGGTTPSNRQGGITMLDIFTATASDLEVFTKADVNATIPDRNGTLRLAPGRYVVHEAGALGGSTLEGVKIRYANGQLGWAAKLDGKYTLSSLSLAEAETERLVGLSPAPTDSPVSSAAKKAAEATVEACHTASKAAENVLGLLGG